MAHPLSWVVARTGSGRARARAFVCSTKGEATPPPPPPQRSLRPKLIDQSRGRLSIGLRARARGEVSNVARLTYGHSLGRTSVALATSGPMWGHRTRTELLLRPLGAPQRASCVAFAAMLQPLRRGSYHFSLLALSAVRCDARAAWPKNNPSLVRAARSGTSVVVVHLSDPLRAIGARAMGHNFSVRAVPSASDRELEMIFFTFKQTTKWFRQLNLRSVLVCRNPNQTCPNRNSNSNSNSELKLKRKPKLKSEPRKTRPTSRALKTNKCDH